MTADTEMCFIGAEHNYAVDVIIFVERGLCYVPRIKKFMKSSKFSLCKFSALDGPFMCFICGSVQ